MFLRWCTFITICLTLTRIYFIVSALEFRYHRNNELESVLKNITGKAKQPLSADIYSIGQTGLGNQLWVVKLTAANKSTIGTPNIKLIGNMHGNEAAGREILLHFIEHLTKNYKTDATITWLLNNTNIHIMPSLNPDGFENANTICDGDIGRNVPPMNVDLNRNFPSFFHDNSKIINRNVNESNAIRKWMENNTFILSAALHGGSLVANYPFDIRKVVKSTLDVEPSYTPDNDVFRHLASTYANNHQTMHRGESCDDDNRTFNGGIVNGAMWYELDGGMGDYNYAFHGCMELTLEISCCKFPNETELPLLWEQNREALLLYSLQALRGVSGQILNYDTHHPITNANLTIVGRPIRFWSSKNTGEFWRILLPGNYTITVQADGFHTQNVSFKVLEYKNDYPKLTHLKIFLQNSSIYTTTEWTTTQMETTTVVTESNSSESPDLESRFVFENVESNTDTNAQMVRTNGVNYVFGISCIYLTIFDILLR